MEVFSIGCSLKILLGELYNKTIQLKGFQWFPWRFDLGIVACDQDNNRVFRDVPSTPVGYQIGCAVSLVLSEEQHPPPPW